MIEKRAVVQGSRCRSLPRRSGRQNGLRKQASKCQRGDQSESQPDDEPVEHPNESTLRPRTQTPLRDAASISVMNPASKCDAQQRGRDPATGSWFGLLRVSMVSTANSLLSPKVSPATSPTISPAISAKDGRRQLQVQPNACPRPNLSISPETNGRKPMVARTPSPTLRPTRNVIRKAAPSRSRISVSPNWTGRISRKTLKVLPP